MMRSILGQQVISAFKRLHRAKNVVFAGDETALSAARLKINEEYKRNSAVTSEHAVRELMAFSDECAEVLSKTVLQARETEPGQFAVRIGRETFMWDNVLYRDDAVLPDGTPAPRCGGGAKQQ